MIFWCLCAFVAKNISHQGAKAQRFTKLDYTYFSNEILYDSFFLGSVLKIVAETM
jgi:hypothetical protein